MFKNNSFTTCCVNKNTLKTCLLRIFAENQSNTNPVPCLSVGVSGGIQALDCPIPLHKIEITSLKYIKL